MKKLRSFKLLFMAVILVVGINTVTYAHNMIINPIEDGKIRVEYDGGSPATRSKISVYNSDDELIQEGDVDEDAIFEFDPEGVAYLVADDGMGHMDTWEAGSDVETGGSKLPAIIGVVVVLGAVAFFFSKKR